MRLTDYTEFYGYDISEPLLRGIDPRVQTKVYDITNPEPLPEVDATILGGVIQYVFDDDKVQAVLSRVTSRIAWIRSTATSTSRSAVSSMTSRACVTGGSRTTRDSTTCCSPQRPRRSPTAR